MRLEDMGTELTRDSEYEGNQYVTCDNCGGRAYVTGPDGETKDCENCDGFGKVRVVADGGTMQKPPEHYGREAYNLADGMREAVLDEEFGQAGEDMVVRIEETMARLREDYQAIRELREMVSE